MPRRQFTPLFTKPWNGRRKKPSQKWRWRYVIWTAIKRTAMAIGFMVLLSALISTLMIGTIAKESQPSIGDKVVLFLPMKKGWVEHKSQNPFSFDVDGQNLAVRQIVDALDAGAKDPKVKGVVASYQGGVYNLDHLYEVRNAINRFKKNDKFAYIFATDYNGGGTGGLGAYYFASAFDEIWLQPMGTLMITGVNAEAPYMRGLLDKIGVEPQFFARKEYKSVFENIARKEPSASNTEMMTALMNNIADYMVDDIARDRAKSLSEMKQLIDRGLFLDIEAERLGLVTNLDYIDRLFKKMRKDIDGDEDSKNVDFVNIGYYGHVAKREHANHGIGEAKKPSVALIYLAGTIMQDKETAGGKLSSAVDVSAAIMSAAEDENIKTIVLRIDSPGGSPTASETIRRSVIRAQDKGKTVIVSMGAMAASGGYWVASAADHIFAAPGTLTGSIGVAGGKVVLQELWRKIGVNWDGVQYGANADLMSFNRKFDAEGERRFNALMDNIYNGFIERVAEGRDMKPETVDDIARGRVWSGLMARDLGLVDEIGGLAAALDYAAQDAGAEDRGGINVIVMPKPKTTFEMVADLLAKQVHMGEMFNATAPVFQTLAPAMDEVRVLGAGEAAMTYAPMNVR